MSDLYKELEKKLKELTADVWNGGYESGYRDGADVIEKNYEKGFIEGLDKAWECAKKINITPFWELEHIFECNPNDIYKMKASEVVAKIERYYEENKQTEECKCDTCVYGQREICTMIDCNNYSHYISNEIDVGDECMYKADVVEKLFVVTRIYQDTEDGKLGEKFFDAIYIEPSLKGMSIRDGKLSLIKKTGRRFNLFDLFKM